MVMEYGAMVMWFVRACAAWVVFPAFHTLSASKHTPMCRYVRGDVRFSSKYSKGSPRKMVATWAEKEMRNLHRLAAAGVPCPKARARRKHVLVMDFVGTDGIAAPRLKVHSCVCVALCGMCCCKL